MNELNESAVKNSLRTRWVGRSYRYIQSVGSTNDFLKHEMAAANPPAGTVVLTDFQSKGRGRLDRRWEAPPGTSLLFSVLFRPTWPAERLPWLTMIAGTAVAESIEAETGLTISLKWPNDVIIKYQGKWHKFCGILLEGQITSNSQLAYAIIGTGINVNIPQQQLSEASFPATSLTTVLNHSVSRLKLLTTLLQRLEVLYDLADQGTSPRKTWEKRLTTIGQKVEIFTSNNEKVVSGLAEGIGQWGELLVRDDSGKQHKILAGDVTLRQSPI